MSIYRIRSKPEWDGMVLAYSIDDAKRRVAKRATKAMRLWLEERGNMSIAQDHRLVMRPYGVFGGLAVVETCDAPPCVWFGQAADDYATPSRNLIEVWYEEMT